LNNTSDALSIRVNGYKNSKKGYCYIFKGERQGLIF